MKAQTSHSVCDSYFDWKPENRHYGAAMREITLECARSQWNARDHLGMREIILECARSIKGLSCALIAMGCDIISGIKQQRVTVVNSCQRGRYKCSKKADTSAARKQIQVQQEGRYKCSKKADTSAARKQKHVQQEG